MIDDERDDAPLDLDDIYDRTSWGGVSLAEAIAVGERLRNPFGNEQRWDLLLVVRLIGITHPQFGVQHRYREVVEHLLDDPRLADSALFTLTEWHGPEPYAKQLCFFLSQNDAIEPFYDMRGVSTGPAGEYLRTHQDVPMLRALLRIFDDDPNESVRANTYIALGRAVGREWGQVPKVFWESFENHEALEQVIDQSIIDEARQRLHLEDQRSSDAENTESGG